MRESFAYRSLNSNNYIDMLQLSLSLSLCCHAAAEFMDTAPTLRSPFPCPLLPLVVAVLCSVYCPVLSSLIESLNFSTNQSASVGSLMVSNVAGSMNEPLTWLPANIRPFRER